MSDKRDGDSASAISTPVLAKRSAPRPDTMRPQFDEVLGAPGARWWLGCDRLSTPPRLSSRETEILRWLACGKSAPEIATILGISPCTVRLHIQSVRRKLNVVNIPHAVCVAFALGVLCFDGATLRARSLELSCRGH